MIEDLKNLLANHSFRIEAYYEMLGKYGLLARNYQDYALSRPIDMDKEMERIETADMTLLGALLTMCLREEYWLEGSFYGRLKAGQPQRIVERMIEICMERNGE